MYSYYCIQFDCWRIAYVTCAHFQSGVSQGLAPKPLLILYGHDDEVTCVAISLELDVALSSSKVRFTLLVIVVLVIILYCTLLKAK